MCALTVLEARPAAPEDLLSEVWPPVLSDSLASEGFSLPVKWRLPPGITMCNVGSGAAGKGVVSPHWVGSDCGWISNICCFRISGRNI